MEKVYPAKLKQGDVVAVVAPSRSLSIVSSENRHIAKRRFAEELGLGVEISSLTRDCDDFLSTPVVKRIANLHGVFRNSKVGAIFTAIGGFSCNQLLDYLDWDLIAANPKVLCGYSDITALQNAIFARTGLVTYSGPHFSTFGQEHMDPYTVSALRACLFEEEPITVQPSDHWNDDRWWEDQEGRTSRPNEGWWAMQYGRAQGTLLGGNLGTFALLFGTRYMPPLKDSVLFLEDDEIETPAMFDRYLQALIHQPGFDGVQALVIGRFQIGSKMTRELLAQIIESKPELRGLAVIANVDFGHTNPMITYPIGGEVSVFASSTEAKIEILRH